MEDRVLVAYASKYGATAGIAEAIGTTLSEAGLTVEVRPAEQVYDLSRYTAVIVGSAVYAGNWRKEAVEFLERFEVELSALPTWFFSSGPTGEGDPLELLHGWRFPEAYQPLADRISPREIALFHGAIDPNLLHLGERLVVKAIRARTGDYRDWADIEKWAASVARALSPVQEATV